MAGEGGQTNPAIGNFLQKMYNTNDDSQIMTLSIVTHFVLYYVVTKSLTLSLTFELIHERPLNLANNNDF